VQLKEKEEDLIRIVCDEDYVDIIIISLSLHLRNQTGGEAGVRVGRAKDGNRYLIFLNWGVLSG